MAEAQVAKELDYLSMSDEEIRNMMAPVAAPAVEDEELEEDPADKIDDPAYEAPDDKSDEDEDDKKDQDESDKEDAEDADDEAGDSQAEEKATEGTEKNKEIDGTKKDPKVAAEEEKKTPDADAIDFEAEYKRLLAPFKANGRDIQVKNADEAITLMQMGANYNKKMAALKPNLKLMKLLENNNLLSEEKIGFLIDLDRKNPAAINKLVKDSGIDPMDLDAEKASAYRQTTYTVDDREIELDTVLDEIQGTSAYNRTLDVVSNKWDAASKQTIAGSPQLLKVINDHVASGVYDLISKEVENERVFGRLNGLSDIEAYRRIGDSLHARGAFNHLMQGSAQPQGKPAPTVVVAPKPKVDDDKLKDKKRAASSTKPVVSNSASEDFNPLAMSDDEFSKLVNKRLM